MKGDLLLQVAGLGFVGLGKTLGYLGVGVLFFGLGVGVTLSCMHWQHKSKKSR